MKVLISSVLLLSCGVLNSKPKTTKVENCSVTQIPGGAVINCPDGSEATISNGNNGLNGLNGENGLDGRDGVSTITCKIESEVIDD